MKESHIAQLSNTVERMLKESDDRIRAVAEERKATMTEKVGVHMDIRTYRHTSIYSCLSICTYVRIYLYVECPHQESCCAGQKSVEA